MARTYAYSANFDSETERLFKNANLLGEGHNGIVYELPGNKAIKIFKETKCWREEYDILEKVNKSKYFPKLYSAGDQYIVREKIAGERLDHYIKKNGINYTLSKNLYNLIGEFKKLNFTKLDARCRDIYVIGANRVRVIDPKECYKRKVAYPRHLMKGLKKIGALESFLQDINDIDKTTGEFWKKKINQYYNENEID